LIAFGFDVLHLARMVATADTSNAASAAVMVHLGMCVEPDRGVHAQPCQGRASRSIQTEPAWPRTDWQRLCRPSRSRHRFRSEISAHKLSGRRHDMCRIITTRGYDKLRPAAGGAAAGLR
jgi:hypothetical protein